jgi:hypothetical protein
VISVQAHQTVVTVEETQIRIQSSVDRSIQNVDDYLRMGQESLNRLRQQGMSLKVFPILDA